MTVEEFLIEYRAWIRSELCKAGFKWDNLDDAYQQICVIMLSETQRSLDTTRASAVRFCMNKVRWTIADFLRLRWRRYFEGKLREGVRTYSLDNTDVDIEDCAFLQKVRLEEIVEELHLVADTDFQHQLLDFALQGFAQCDIAVLLHASPVRISRECKLIANAYKLLTTQE